jgi:hypothetical protein
MDDSVPGQLSARLLYLELRAHRAHGSAYLVVARRGKAPLLPPPQLSTAGARFPTLAADGVLLDQQFSAICQVASRRARAMSVRTPTPVPPGAT